MEYIGKSPVPLPILIIGKLALFACALFFAVKSFNLGSMIFDSFVTRVFGISLSVVGCTVMLAAIFQLGQSVAVGLPEKTTELRTHGLYGFTRNPIYLGAFIICAGSCFYSIHPVNFMLFAVAVAIHISIVKKEEEFLEKRFGTQWLEYRRQVPRFFGRRRRSDSGHERAKMLDDVAGK
jgi:protein-S-isoprenylcysteine O-methyltransferase Ste14